MDILFVCNDCKRNPPEASIRQTSDVRLPWVCSTRICRIPHISRAPVPRNTGCRGQLSSKHREKLHASHPGPELYRTRSPRQVGESRLRQFSNPTFRRTLTADPEALAILNVFRDSLLAGLTRSSEKGRLDREFTRPYCRIPQNSCSHPDRRSAVVRQWVATGALEPRPTGSVYCHESLPAGRGP